MKTFQEFLTEEISNKQETRKHVPLATHNRDHFDYGKMENRFTLHHPDGSKTHHHTREEMHAHLKKYGDDIRKPKKTKGNYKNETYYGVPNAAHAAAVPPKPAPITSVTHKGLTMSKGEIKNDKGETVARADRYLQHGYHPAVQVKVPGHDHKHFEVDHPNLHHAILDHVDAILKK